jgi:uncharacterized membrane protein
MTSPRFSIGKRIAPPRFLAFALLLIAGLAVMVPMLGFGRGAMIAFDIASFVFLASLWPLIRNGAAERMRDSSKRNDANRAGLLGITGATMIVILVAVANELHDKAGPTVPLILGTLVLAWTFSNTIYALHYAHVFYLEADGKDSGGLTIPECDEPDYWDFLYFSFTLGMTFQTSDVEITSRRLRRIALFQCLAAFVFNLGVIAFSINVLGGGK